MSDFGYYDREPKKSGRGFLIAALMIVAIAVAGAIVVQYIAPYFSTTEVQTQEQTQIEETTSDEADETEATQTEQTTETTVTTETVEKVITYVESDSGIPDIVEAVSDAVVGVVNYTETTTQGFGGQTTTTEEIYGTGSGVIISSDGYIVTNYHVIEDASRITVMLSTGEEMEAEIVGGDQYVDLAVLKIDKDDLTYMTFGDSESTRVGELAIAIGYPLTDDFSTTTVTAGIISALGVSVEVDGITFEMIQTDAPINPGNSGGALVDGSGQLIGINTSKTVYAGTTSYGTTISAEGIGYAIPSYVAEEIVNELIEYGEVERPFIGISYSAITESQSEYYDIPMGIYIGALTTGGPAETVGLEVNDIITHINGTETLDTDDLYSFIMSSEVGETVTLTVYRYSTGETFEVDLTFGSTLDY